MTKPNIRRKGRQITSFPLVLIEMAEKVQAGTQREFVFEFDTEQEARAFRLLVHNLKNAILNDKANQFDYGEALALKTYVLPAMSGNKWRVRLIHADEWAKGLREVTLPPAAAN